MIYQFQPHALQKMNAKVLLLDDADYSKPSDHYFSYINQRQGTSDDMRDSMELDILK